MFVDFTWQLHQYLSWQSSCNDFNQDLGVSEGIPFCDAVQDLKHVCLTLDYPLTYTITQTFQPPIYEFCAEGFNVLIHEELPLYTPL
jgi:hypothetical protein